MEDRRRRVIVLAYSFPPVGGVDSRGAPKFITYVSLFGWDCTAIQAAHARVAECMGEAVESVCA